MLGLAGKSIRVVLIPTSIAAIPTLLKRATPQFVLLVRRATARTSDDSPPILIATAASLNPASTVDNRKRGLLADRTTKRLV
jgi:hypothetical protein